MLVFVVEIKLIFMAISALCFPPCVGHEPVAGLTAGRWFRWIAAWCEFSDAICFIPWPVLVEEVLSLRLN